MREYLKSLRTAHGVSQQFVADKVNITRQYYQQIEAGERQQQMEIAFAVKLAAALEVTPEFIIEKEREWLS